jgi:hypothetical protein
MNLQPEHYAYRADRSALDAVKQVHKLLSTGHGQIVRRKKTSKKRFDTHRPSHGRI